MCPLVLAGIYCVIITIQDEKCMMRAYAFAASMTAMHCISASSAHVEMVRMSDVINE